MCKSNQQQDRAGENNCRKQIKTVKTNNDCKMLNFRGNDNLGL